MIKNTIVRVNIVPERYLKELNIGFYECKIDSDERTVTIIIDKTVYYLFSEEENEYWNEVESCKLPIS